MQPFIISIFFILSILSFGTGTAEAYLTTNQEATKIDTKTLLLSIDYEFGSKKNAVHMPVLGANTVEKKDRTVSYSIVDAEGKIVPGTSFGLVFSKAPLTKNLEYVTPVDIAHRFSLMVLFSPETLDPEKEYRLQVNHLPFSFNGVIPLQLNPSELQYYKTELILL